MVYIPECK